VGSHACGRRHPHGDDGRKTIVGLFISPLQSSTGLGITPSALRCHRATDVGRHPAGLRPWRIVWSARILIAGLVVLAIGMALTPFMTSGFGLIVSLGVLSAIVPARAVSRC